MNLNKQGREELRKKIEEQLQNVPEGKRVHIDRELLERLIFEEYDILETTADNSKTNKGKVIVWSGDFLKKIDLSEVSFDNVIWNISGAYRITPFTFIDSVVGETHKVNLSGTNAKIDFSKSFDALHPFDYYGNSVPVGTKKCVAISDINFANVDLSSSNFDYVVFIDSCCLDYTNALIKLEEPEENMFLFQIENSSLKGIDLSEYTISATNLFANMGQYYHTTPDEDDEEVIIELRKQNIKPKRFFLESCNLTETGLNVNLTATDKIIGKIVDYDMEKGLGNLIKHGYLNGCYVNGKKIHSLEERQAIAQEKKAEYEKMKEDLINSTISSIEEQTSGFGIK